MKEKRTKIKNKGQNRRVAKRPDRNRGRIRVQDLLGRIPEHRRADIVLARAGQRICSLNDWIDPSDRVEWLRWNTVEAYRACQQTLCLVLLRATEDLYPGRKLLIDHSLGKGFYIRWKDGKPITLRSILRLKIRMVWIAKQDFPIHPVRPAPSEARRILSESGNYVSLHAGQRKPLSPVFQSCNGRMYLLEHPLLASTGRIAVFGLEPRHPGMILRFPEESDPDRLSPRIAQPKLFRVFREFSLWERILGIENVSALNLAVGEGRIAELIKIAEGLHEKRIAAIADEVLRRGKGTRLILISGPSSSGKTTFTKRLYIQLRVNGFRPLAVSLDDYFLDRDKTPLDNRGRPDYESVEAVDTGRLNRDLGVLLKGGEITLPIYDFRKGTSSPGRTVRLEPHQPILIEGLHALNDRVTASIPRRTKFKIYISALTQLNITDAIRVPTSDVRLLRRMIRDSQFRGHSAEHTLRNWISVRQGEEKYIFPFQEQSDTIFNSALTYELSVLNRLCLVLLEAVRPSSPVFPEAQRLITLLTHFASVPETHVPSNSILREFIGGSSFEY